MIVLGIGNVLMQDDGIGVYLAGELKKEKQVKGIQYIIGETDIDFCLDAIDDADFLVVLDAVQFGGEKGSLHEFEFAELTALEPGIAAHHYHLLNAISSRKGMLIGIEPFEIGFHYGLSPQLEKVFPFLLLSVRKRIRRLASYNDFSAHSG
ncbi:hydrogenase maturation protease [Bacillus sp. REN3]|uniref:hydrogenase maturation protease n=1 Tax=Bacillus sp. REN3 TaxID=2802440 RepID=UPI001AED748A|nr:hydrogenase maturation protease [Bacillus sp. REN3]